MHYYQFNIGDYSSHTSRLSLLEDLTYRRLLDLYYLTERPLNGCSTDVARDIGMIENQVEVDYILSKFFRKEGDTWVNGRADREIKAYQNKLKMASKAGKASGKARQLKASEQTFNECSTDVQPTKDDEPTNKQEPLTINHKPLTNVKNKGFIKPTLEELQFEFDGRVTNPYQQANTFFNHYESNGWMVGKTKMKSWKHAVTNWITRGNQNGNKQFKTRDEQLEASFRKAGFYDKADNGNFETIGGLEIDTTDNRKPR